MIKSLQSKMILIMFLFIFLIILFSAIISIIRMEQVYYSGFNEEMLNTISSFGIEANNSTDNKDGKEDASIDKLISNFSIYFSINKTNRNGMILDKDYKILFASQKDELTDEIRGYIDSYSNNPEMHQLVNTSNEYYFIYFIKDLQTNANKYIIVVSQDKTYINGQLRDVILFYVACLIIISIITVIVSTLLASNVTKPIEIIRKKAQKIAARRRY